IARNLSCNLLERDCPTPVRRKAAVNLDAYNSYLAGRYHMNQRGKEPLLKALDCFRDATKADPNYSQAWSGLAEACVLVAARSLFDRDPVLMLEEAHSAARRALELDQALPEAHVALALVKM